MTRPAAAAIAVVLLVASACASEGSKFDAPTTTTPQMTASTTTTTIPPTTSTIPPTTSTGASRTLTGSVTIRGSTYDDINSDWPDPITSDEFPCQGDGAFSDLAPGASIIVKDGDGTILAVGRLGVGLQTLHTLNCVMPFEVPAVPEAPFYTIQLGQRSGPAYSWDELEAAGWSISLNVDS